MPTESDFRCARPEMTAQVQISTQGLALTWEEIKKRYDVLFCNVTNRYIGEHYSPSLKIYRIAMLFHDFLVGSTTASWSSSRCLVGMAFCSVNEFTGLGFSIRCYVEGLRLRAIREKRWQRASVSRRNFPLPLTGSVSEIHPAIQGVRFASN